MRTKRRTSPGGDPGAGAASLFVAAVVVACGMAAGGLAFQPQSYALVAGTVFRDTGLSLPGAQIRLEPVGDAKAARKIKKQEAITDARGEFAIRVPAGPMQYKLRTRAPGYQPQEKPVSVSGEERIDVFFRLEPASNRERTSK
ncbi:MAG: carboxypeptidase regulatory-like domain-containing protein [Acidobacteriota bacterium]